MATPAQIRSERKSVLKQVRTQLNQLETQSEKLERLINRVLKVKKRLPDVDDATIILQSLRDMDKQLDNVLKSATTFSNFVRST